MNDLIIKNTKNKGRGVFANRDFKIGETIEICPVIVISSSGVDQLGKSILDEYFFLWESKEDAAIALGYGSLYNHSLNNNAIFEKDLINKTLIIKSINDIKKGDEIFINYFGDEKEKEDWLWFEDKK